MKPGLRDQPASSFSSGLAGTLILWAEGWAETFSVGVRSLHQAHGEQLCLLRWNHGERSLSVPEENPWLESGQTLGFWSTPYEQLPRVPDTCCSKVSCSNLFKPSSDQLVGVGSPPT